MPQFLHSEHYYGKRYNRLWQDIQIRNEAKILAFSAREKLQQAKEKAIKSVSHESVVTELEANLKDAKSWQKKQPGGLQKPKQKPKIQLKPSKSWVCKPKNRKRSILICKLKTGLTA